jgi:hypothetical protein
VRWLKGIGYVLAAMLAIAAVLAVGAIISAVLAAIGTIIVGGAAVGFVALLIKEFCGSKNRR